MFSSAFDQFLGLIMNQDRGLLLFYLTFDVRVIARLHTRRRRAVHGACYIHVHSSPPPSLSLSTDVPLPSAWFHSEYAD